MDIYEYDKQKIKERLENILNYEIKEKKYVVRYGEEIIITRHVHLDDPEFIKKMDLDILYEYNLNEKFLLPEMTDDEQTYAKIKFYIFEKDRQIINEFSDIYNFDENSLREKEDLFLHRVDYEFRKKEVAREGYITDD